jgi:hypothetical protein
VSNYLAPAVYVEETSFRAPSIEGVGTTTTAFAGPALTGPAGGTPQVLSSFGDFQSIYGGFDQLGLTNNPTDPQNVNYLALSVKAFFDNGGSVLYVSRVFSPSSGSGDGERHQSTSYGHCALSGNVCELPAGDAESGRSEDHDRQSRRVAAGLARRYRDAAEFARNVVCGGRRRRYDDRNYHRVRGDAACIRTDR